MQARFKVAQIDQFPESNYAQVIVAVNDPSNNVDAGMLAFNIGLNELDSYPIGEEVTVGLFE